MIASCTVARAPDRPPPHAGMRSAKYPTHVLASDSWRATNVRIVLFLFQSAAFGFTCVVKIENAFLNMQNPAQACPKLVHVHRLIDGPRRPFPEHREHVLVLID